MPCREAAAERLAAALPDLEVALNADTMKIAAWMLGSLLVVDVLCFFYAEATAEMYEGFPALPYALAIIPLFLLFLAVLTVHLSRARPPSRPS